MQARIWIPALLALAAGPSFAAAPCQDTAVEQAGARAERLEQILEAYSDAMKSFRKAYGEAASDREKRAIFEESYPNPVDWFPDLWTLVDANPGDSAAAEALVWIVQNDREGDHAARASEILIAEHIDSEALGEVCFTYSSRVQDGRAFLEHVMAESPHRAVRASARFWLASLLLQEVDYAGQLAAAEGEELGGYRDYFGAETTERLAALDPEATSSLAEDLLLAVQRDDPDVEHPHRGTLGVAAEAILFELHDLVVGKVAPDIEAEDLDGVPFKLSDYRGKVIVLDFWGNW